METICMKCPILFSEQNETKVNKHCLLDTPRKVMVDKIAALLKY